jgi:hypothetical protein
MKGDVTALTALSPFTHVYSVDAVLPPEVFQKYINLVATSPSVRYWVTYNNAAYLRNEITLLGGVEFKLKTQFTIKMCGSGEQKTSFIYEIIRSAEAKEGQEPMEERDLTVQRHLDLLTNETKRPWIEDEIRRTTPLAART